MRTVAAACAALSLAGCFHATHVDKPGEGTSSNGASQPKSSEGGPAAQPRSARRPQKPGRPPLAAEPGALFVPGAVAQIQKALASRGYLSLQDTRTDKIDEATSAAIRKFQSDEGIARTGNPDHETVRRLGLDADQLFRKGSAAQESK